MPSKIPHRLYVYASLALALAWTASAQAQTHLLVMGGGSKPSSNQVSLEKNVNYFYRVVDRLGLGDASRDVLFACGDDGTIDDLEYIHDASSDPATMRLIDALIGPGKGQSTRYRPHDIGGGEAMSSRRNIQAWFDDHADELDADDKLMLYFTGHGGKGQKSNTQNTSLYLWPNHNIRMTAFTSELDKLDPQTPVVMVMVQCYSGGFANVIFEGGDPANGLSEHNRCGFFAAVHSRVAAGCTPNVNEADYKEYSSYFWAALSGEDRLGEPVERPDYDGDGVTSYLEAHAFAMIHSDSTDLSMTTTDRLARALMSPGPEMSAMAAKTGYGELRDKADPARQAILDGLSERLDLAGEQRVARARAAISQARRDRRTLRGKQRTISQALPDLRTQLTEPLLERWPELADAKSDQAMEAVVDNAEAIRQAIAGTPAYAEMTTKLNELDEIKARMDELTARLAHAERFVYTSYSIVYIDLLQQFGTDEQVAAYNALLEREMASVSP